MPVLADCEIEEDWFSVWMFYQEDQTWAAEVRMANVVWLQERTHRDTDSTGAIYNGYFHSVCRRWYVQRRCLFGRYEVRFGHVFERQLTFDQD